MLSSQHQTGYIVKKLLIVKWFNILAALLASISFFFSLLNHPAANIFFLVSGLCAMVSLVAFAMVKKAGVLFYISIVMIFVFATLLFGTKGLAMANLGIAIALTISGDDFPGMMRTLNKWVERTSVGRMTPLRF